MFGVVKLGRFRPQERLKAMLAAWLQEFLGARGRAMLAWEEAFSGRVTQRWMGRMRRWMGNSDHGTSLVIFQM